MANVRISKCNWCQFDCFVRECGLIHEWCLFYGGHLNDTHLYSPNCNDYAFNVCYRAGCNLPIGNCLIIAAIVILVNQWQIIVDPLKHFGAIRIWMNLPTSFDCQEVMQRESHCLGTAVPEEVKTRKWFPWHIMELSFHHRDAHFVAGSLNSITTIAVIQKSSWNDVMPFNYGFWLAIFRILKLNRIEE